MAYTAALPMENPCRSCKANTLLLQEPPPEPNRTRSITLVLAGLEGISLAELLELLGRAYENSTVAVPFGPRGSEYFQVAATVLSLNSSAAAGAAEPAAVDYFCSGIQCIARRYQVRANVD